MMHYPAIDPSGVAYGSHSPNVTVMSRGPSAAAMQAAAWTQNPNCRYNPSAAPTDYMSGTAAFGPDTMSNFYSDGYRHPLISASSAVPGVYYPSHQMLMNRSMASPAELNISESPVATNRAQSTSELASPTDSLGSKGTFFSQLYETACYMI